MDMLKRGSLVEFTDTYHRQYPPEDDTLVKFGISTKIQPVDNCEVRTIRGVEIARYVYAYDWAGWMPESLEIIYAREFLYDVEDY